MTNRWTVLDETDRQQWNYVPFTNVGPLRFGATYEEVLAALSDAAVFRIDGETGNPFDLLLGSGGVNTSAVRLAEFCLPKARSIAVTAYFHETGGLYCVAVDARCGPQVVMDGVRLAGRVPSELREELINYSVSHDIKLADLPEGDPGLDDVGLFIRVQRAGDVLLTRPLLATAHSGAASLYDSIPTAEWNLR